jgi:hypothetical protein
MIRPPVTATAVGFPGAKTGPPVKRSSACMFRFLEVSGE